MKTTKVISKINRYSLLKEETFGHKRLKEDVPFFICWQVNLNLFYWSSVMGRSRISEVNTTLYLIHVSGKSLDPNFKYNCARKKADDTLKNLAKKVEVPTPEIGSVGYEDSTIFYDAKKYNHSQVMGFAKKLANVVPSADWDGGNVINVATMGGEDDMDFIDSVDVNIVTVETL